MVLAVYLEDASISISDRDLHVLPTDIYFVVWKQRLTLALLLTRSNPYMDPKKKPFEGTSLEAWTERDNQVAATWVPK